MLVVTTPGIAGKKVDKTIGMVTGEAILGANIFKDMFAGIRDIVGGRSGAYEKELNKARDIAVAEMKQRAFELGATDIIAVDIDYESIDMGGGNMLMVTACGTAVVTSPV